MGVKPVAKLGQPTLYNASKLKVAKEYVVKYNSKHGHAIPSIAGLAVILNVCRSTIYNWSEAPKNKDFLYTLGQIATHQEFKLLNGGLIGDFNPAITKLALANHGYNDKPEEPGNDKELSDALHKLADALPS